MDLSEYTPRDTLAHTAVRRMTYAFGAFGRVNLVNLHAHEDGIVGALGFTHIAVDALVGDHQSHGEFKRLF